MISQLGDKSKGEKLMRGWALWTLYGLALAIAVGASCWFISEGWPDKGYYAAPIIGSLIVSIGWIVTSENTIRNSQKDQTIKIVTATNHNHKADWGIVYRYLPGADDVLALPGESSVYPDAKHELYTAVDALLNDFDFIAVGALSGVYDRPLLENSLEPDFSTLYGLARRYIRYTQESEDDFEIWRPFCTLSERWYSVAHGRSPRGKRNLNRAVRLSWRLGYLAGSIKRMM
jgi:hypothetical protein